MSCRQRPSRSNIKTTAAIGGWIYAPWRGTFYPKGLRQADELAYAASAEPLLQDVTERLAWLNKHAADPDFASALLTAPAAVTGLKPGEPKFLREQFEKVVHTEAAEDRPRALQALDDLDRGARNAINRVCQAAGVRADELSDADAEPVDEAA